MEANVEARNIEKTYASLENLQFLLNEVFEAQNLSQYAHFDQYDQESINMMVNAAKQIADTHMFPVFEAVDRFGTQYENGRIQVHEAVGEFMRVAGEGGWIGARAPYEKGGMQMPSIVYMAAEFLFLAANNSLSGYMGLTAGAASLIYSFGAPELEAAFVPKMLAGDWQGTMALTEPQAGSSLSDIVTSATPTEAGHYLIEGQKIFISGGDHQGVDNVVHLMLARIKDAPAGTKGISLFVVPRLRPGEGGVLEENDLQVAGAFHKMGQSGYATTHLIMGEKGDCHGYLVGMPNMGLRYMFQMMNAARLGVGTTGIGIASAAYYASLKYAYERAQGRRLNNRDLSRSQDLIAHHPDVRRMLFRQKAIVEGGMGVLFQCAYYEDMMHITEGEENEKYALLLDLLTPIAKTFPSEYGAQSVSEGLQVLGGYGYCKDFPLEQLYRDIRISAIYEGTTGIQSQDLLGRKVLMREGKTMQLFMGEIQETMQAAAQHESLAEEVKNFQTILGRVQEVTMHLLGVAQKGDKEVFLSDANLYMEMFSLATVAWQLLKQAVVAQEGLNAGAVGDQKAFYTSKIKTMQFFFAYELPKTLGLAARLKDPAVFTVMGAGDEDLLR
ncbi:MAG: acyl-CoA dehydrogenase [Bacteroidota bacterium]